MNDTRQALDQSREASVANVVASVVPRLDEQDRKLNLLMRPWWRRVLGH
jgi:hypothetical protein